MAAPVVAARDSPPSSDSCNWYCCDAVPRTPPPPNKAAAIAKIAQKAIPVVVHSAPQLVLGNNPLRQRRMQSRQTSKKPIVLDMARNQAALALPLTTGWKQVVALIELEKKAKK